LHRARRLLPSDVDVWYACGVEELAAGDRSAAETSWRRSLELGPGRLKPVLKASAGLSAAELRERVLPDDPAVLMAAAAERPAAERRVFVEPAADAAKRDGLTVPQLTAVAMACDELDRVEDAAAVWKRATAANPNLRELRDAAARWFEKQERYADAVPHLEWLRARTPTDAGLRDRLAAARHGSDLKRIIGR
jgi:tetratricopeptide (TPR) repeat protein